MVAQSKKEGVCMLSTSSYVFLPITQRHAITIRWQSLPLWIWVIVSWRITLISKRQVQKSKWWSLLGWMSLKLVKEELRLFHYTYSECSCSLLTNSRGLAGGQHAPVHVCMWQLCGLPICSPTAIMSRCVALPAGRSWQSEKSCVKFFLSTCRHQQSDYPSVHRCCYMDWLFQCIFWRR